MSRFYGSVQGSRGEATRLGGKESGLITKAAGWGGCIEVWVYYCKTHEADMFEVRLKQWGSSRGEPRVIAEGFLNSEISEPFIPALIA